MKWTPQHFLLPVLIGFTGVSIALVYLLYKKDEEDDSSESSFKTTKSITAEIKIPRQLVPALIGRGGATLKDLENKTETQICFSQDNIDCPHRICQIKGKPESIHSAEMMIKDIIKNQPLIETYEMRVPQRAYGKLLERGGDTIQHIQNTSHSKIILDNNIASIDQNTDRRLIIMGTAEQIATALSQVEDLVREENRLYSALQDNLNCRLPRAKTSPRETAISKAENTTPSKELPSIQATDGLMDVYVSAMENPSQFWIQVVGPGTISLDKLVADMTEYYNDGENRELHTLRNIAVGRIVSAKFIDNKWYRAEVLTVLDDGSCTVYFMDYGDHQIYSSSDIKDGEMLLELRTDFLSLRQQAIECSIANIKPHDTQWSEEACDRFEELTWLAQWKVLLAKVRGYKERILGYGKSRREGSPIPCVELYDPSENKYINIGKILVEEGLAVAEEGAWSAASSTLSLSKRLHDVSSTPRSNTPASNTPTTRRALSPEVVEQIDLTTPRKRNNESVEVIDLVTPIKNEERTFVQNGSGDHVRNGNFAKYGPLQAKQGLKPLNIQPAGYESDLSADSDELELG